MSGWKREQLVLSRRIAASEFDPSSPQASEEILGACARDHTCWGRRDLAMLTLLFECGVPEADLRKLDLAHYERERGVLALPGSEVSNPISLSSRALEALDAWIEVRGAIPGALFHPIQRPARVLRHRLPKAIVRTILRRRARAADRESSFRRDVSALRQQLSDQSMWRGGRMEQSAVDRYLLHMAKRSRTLGREALDALASEISNGEKDAETLDWSAIRVQDIPDVTFLTRRYPIAVVRRMKRCLNGVLKELLLSGKLDEASYQRLTSVSWMRTSDSHLTQRSSAAIQSLNA